MAKRKTYESHQLVLTNGETVELLVADNDAGMEFWEELISTIPLSGFYYIGNWVADVTATYKGKRLDNINMNLVVGICG